ncbi:bifunctional (p)ppGpp synthetase/guanosine-3',5'-bis(diphosphate) 3'-pyrophosphohydrolase [Luteimonas aestuarii]|uniref:GTP pyrophosphokinase n=1 Tax=Luteimonas aestuarii TaxID=453837 RepID=A0A4R5TSS8_9GAMM|nr:bifunctional (p)ppGpp synthetase/guanosine-3',5'-bis(diphosphate) 3'-pyrophosphohydrolase [Luteimonas aestuarii]TDK20487.1 bifunctional (p)ppGpp synthetase/guanosine-3',5'-bis(diphosphate) 3'-pyrophosphohydrolase [Luteimonas aestuarii]
MATATAADLDTLLSLPACTSLDAGLRALLHEAADASPAAAWAGTSAEARDTLEALALLKADGESVAAAILAMVPAWREALRDALPSRQPAVALLLDGLQAAGQVRALHAERGGAGNAEGLRRLLLAMVRDLRVVPVLLAQQLAKLRAAPTLPQDEREALARLTRDIHAPLANRLGIWQLKWELEDLAFRHLEPETYRRIAALLDDKRVGRERFIEQVKQQLGEALAAQGVHADIAGRPKHIYSIWKKMRKKDVPIGELYDLRAVRVLVDDVAACYAALGVVHALWLPVPGEFDDYIARPKNNDYRSLHTAVVGPEGKTLEVQIRTREMHEQAELGVAAHWRYKETGGSQRSSAANASLDRKIEWMRRLLESHGEAAGDGALASGFDAELVEDRVYALTPMGEVIDLPAGATPLDFAYHVHTMVGHRCRGAKVDGRIVPLDHVLHSGDRVEILTGKTAEPRRDWLLASNGFLASARSREKVRTWFHKLDRERNLQAGREMLDKELRRLGLLNADLVPVLSKFNVTSADDLCVLVALGDAGPHQVGRALLERERADAAPSDAAQVRAVAPQRVPKAAASAFTVVGVGNLLVQIARCCHPLPGEAIAGYLTRTRGVTVHRSDCVAYRRLAAQQPQRTLPVEWGRAGGGHEAAVVVDAVDRRHLLRDLGNLIAQEDAHVLSIANDVASGGRVRFRLRLRVHDFGQLSRLLGKIESLPGVERASRGEG